MNGAPAARDGTVRRYSARRVASNGRRPSGRRRAGEEIGAALPASVATGVASEVAAPGLVRPSVERPGFTNHLGSQLNAESCPDW
jgi:hypothetical protein